MQCCVPNCKNNNSGSLTQSAVITYHDIPTEPALRESWLRALSERQWLPGPNSVVCSDHFAPEDLCLTIGGHWTVKTGVLPRANRSEKTTAELGASKHDYLVDVCPSRVCHICLSTNTPLHTLKDYKLDRLYEELTGLPIASAMGFSTQLCPLCTRRLTNHARFRDCARASHRLLTHVLSRQREQTQSVQKLRLEAQETIAQLPTLTRHRTQQYDIDIARTDNGPPLLKGVKLEIEKLQLVNIDGQYHPAPSTKDARVKIKKQRIAKEDGKVVELEPLNALQQIKEEKDCPDYFEEDDAERDAVIVKDDAPPKEETVDNVEDLEENSVAWCPAIDNSSDDSSDGFKKQPKRKKKINKKVCGKIVKKERLSDIDNVLDSFLDEPKERVNKNITVKAEGAPKVTKIARNSSGRNQRERGTKKAKVGRPSKLLTEDNKPYFTVTKMKLEDQLALLEKRKESKNFVNSAFKCTLCYKGFMENVSYERHMFRHSDQCGTFECNVCKLRFKSNRVLMHHYKSFHKEQYTCTQCPFVTLSRTAAGKHQKWHIGTKYQCKKCPAEFENVSSYFSHVRTNHPSNISCQLCGYSFTTDKGLAQHMSLMHRTDQLLLPMEGPRCEECDKIFATEEALSTHRGVQHDKSMRNDSGHARIQKAKKMNRQVHVQSDGTWSRTCEICNISFPSPRHYYPHMARVHGHRGTNAAPTQCHLCGKILSTPALYRYHMDAHDDSVTYPCAQCGKTFQTNHGLYQHSKRHSMTSRPACPLCRKTFSSAHNRDRHVKNTHKAVRDVKCEYCPKTFKSLQVQRQHTLYIHLEKPCPKRVPKRKHSEA